jgi:hypothetical protein
MARKHTKSMKRRTHRGRKHRGGGWGFTGPQSIPGTPGTVSNPQVFTGIGDCRAVKPGYDIPYSQYGASFKGLPGMSGGKRKSTRKGRKGKKTRKQRGGRYGFFPESIGTVTPNGAAWWAGTYPPVQRIACEGGSFNPLNPTHTGSSAPPGAANPNYYLKGGAQQLAPATYGVGNVDSMYHYSPTAGYANTASTWKDSVGAPVQIQVPYAARAMNQACLTTGGHPPLTGALQKGGRRTRKGGGLLNNLGDKAKNATSGLFSGITGLFGMGSAPGANAVGANAVETNAVGANAVGANATGTNGTGANVSAATSEVEEESPAAPTAVEGPPPVVMGGKRKRRHHKKKTHKRKH